MYLQHPHIRESIREGGLPIAVYTRWSHTDSHKMSLSLPLVHATEWERIQDDIKCVFKFCGCFYIED